ncbi:hypothetical protein PMIN07_002701 [Paraphaeosphaeria minitans]
MAEYAAERPIYLAPAAHSTANHDPFNEEPTAGKEASEPRKKRSPKKYPKVPQGSDLGSPSNPIPLLIGLKLLPGAQVSILPDVEFTADKGVHILSSPSSLTISISRTPGYGEVQIIPTSRLTSAFRNGWNKLPSELKVMIIAPTVSYSYDAKSTVIGYHNFFPGFEEKVLPWVRLSPETGAIAMQAFYENNTFWIVRHTKVGGETDHVTSHFILPPPDMAKHIHSLVFELSMDSHAFRLLAEISRGEHGFTGLTRVLVNIVDQLGSFALETMTPWDRDAFEGMLGKGDSVGAFNMLTRGKKISFSVKGRAELRGIWHMGVLSPDDWNGTPAGRESLKQIYKWLEESISFAGPC